MLFKRGDMPATRDDAATIDTRYAPCCYDVDYRRLRRR